METNNELQNEYIQRLSKKERRAYEIAKNHLQTSFDLEKSIGFKNFIKNKEENQPKK